MTAALLNFAGVDTHCQWVITVHYVHCVAVVHQQGLVIGYLVGIGGHLRQGEQDAVVEVIEMGVTLDVRGVGNIVEYSQSIIKAP